MIRLFTLGAIAALCSIQATAAAGTKWYLSQTYDASNFFDKFEFFASDYTTGDYNDVDPTSGFVNYLSYADASKVGMAAVKGSDVYLGADSTRKLVQGRGEKGRDSIRVESKETFNHGLFIARFSHIPKPKCGSWPAFWSYGANWPTQGEIDIIEQWNLATANMPTFHTGLSEHVGMCVLADLDGLASIITPDCDNASPTQSINQGCSFTDPNAPLGRDDGGVYAMEWTPDAIKLYAWTWDSVPENLGSDAIDTAFWGSPSVIVPNALCDIDRHFLDHRLVINMNFCGPLAGDQDVWDDECRAVTKAATCNDYVAQNPKEFADIFFQIQDIRIFGTEKPVNVPSPKPTASSTPSSAIKHSTTVLTSTTNTKASTSTTPSAQPTISIPTTDKRPSSETNSPSTTNVRPTKSASKTKPTPSPDLIVLLPSPIKSDPSASTISTVSYTTVPRYTATTHRSNSGMVTPTPALETLRTASSAPSGQPTGASGDDGDDNDTTDVPDSEKSTPASSISLSSPTAPAGSSSGNNDSKSGGSRLGVALAGVAAVVAVLIL